MDTAKEQRLGDLAATVEAGEQAQTERSEMIRELRASDPATYTQVRLAELARISQQAVSRILGSGGTWEIKVPHRSQTITVTGASLREAVLAKLDHVAKAYEFGDASGYRVVGVDTERVKGSKTAWTVIVEHQGLLHLHPGQKLWCHCDEDADARPADRKIKEIWAQQVA